MKNVFSLTLLLFLCANTVLAQTNSNDFRIRIFGTTDTTPPSTPTLLSVSPVAQTQIDVSWSAATDDYAVGGYLVLRDGVTVATTTLLSYADTGLVASTTYSYMVQAFDTSFNYSSTSNSLSTTTLKTPPSTVTPTQDDSPTQSTAARVVLDELRVEEGFSTTTLYLLTKHPSRLEVRWGKTASYELGYTISNVYSKDHTVLLTDLEPGTKYEYEVIGYTPFGFQSVIYSGSFVTKSQAPPISIVNVSRFQATRSGDDVNLSWQLPTDENISHVRIVRSHLGFPEHPQNGAIVYQGLKGAVSDVGILKQYSPVYYTAFVYDKFGNVSSGAVAVVYAVSDKPTNNFDTDRQNDTLTDSESAVVTDEATSSVNSQRVAADMKMPQPTEIFITQGDQTFTLFDTGLSLDSEKSFFISIPRPAIAGNLKSIIATIKDPTDTRKSYSFLLRINQDQSAYVATVAPLKVVGQSQVKIDIYDYEAFVVATYKTPITFAAASENLNNEVIFPDAAYERPYMILLVILLPLIILLVFFIFYRNRAEDNE